MGTHNIYNSLAAIAVGLALGCDITALIKGVEGFSGDGNRQNIYMHGGVRIFDDTYNASPDSMRAAMSVMSGFSGKKTLVLGDMLELGQVENEAHANLANDVYKCGAARVICLGNLMKNLYDALDLRVEKHHCTTHDEALEILKKTVYGFMAISVIINITSTFL